MTAMKILIVDDEKNILQSLKRLLRNQNYEVIIADNAEQALEIIKQDPDIAVVLSDNHMPGMKGMELLQQVKVERPDTIRLLMSAYQDFNDIISALNDGTINRFITKPWDNEQIQQIILNSLENYETNKLDLSINLYLDGYTALPNQLNIINHLKVITDQDNKSWGIFLLAIANYDELEMDIGVEKVNKLAVNVSKNIKQLLPNFFIGRFSEDCFIILNPFVSNQEDCAQFAEKLLADLPSSYKIGNLDLDLIFKAGISLYPDHGASCSYLIRNAQLGLDAALHTKLSNYRYYQPGINGG